MPYLKNAAPPELLAELDRLEKQADQCEFGLAIYNYPVDIATWGLLSQFLLAIEEAIWESGYGSKSHRAAMMNLGKSGTTALEWLRKHCKPESGEKRRWTKKLRKAAFEAQEVARNYFHFLSDFPMWRKNRLLAEIIGPEHIRFSSFAEDNQRRIRAYQQGHRIQGWPTTPDEPLGTGAIKDDTTLKMFAALLKGCKPVGRRGFGYPDSSELLLRLKGLYLAQHASRSRWPSCVMLGGYTLGEFQAFYAALQAICSVHHDLSFRWRKRNGRYPVNSGGLAKRPTEWRELLAEISGIDKTAVDQILSDLTFGRTPSPDMYIHPFIPSGNGGSRLFLVPQFPLSSNAEENILRVFSYAHPHEYDTFSTRKEEEMRKDLQAANPHGFSFAGPIRLPRALPDIDLLVEDVASSTLLIVELKWCRKTLRSRDHISRDNELLYGVEQQLKRIQQFVNNDPGYLLSFGACKRSVVDYASVEYLVVARDHLVWIPPKDNRHIVAHDAFKRMLVNHTDLRAGITDLLTYDWLPVEGREFVVRPGDYAEANGVIVESEIYYPCGPRLKQCKGV